MLALAQLTKRQTEGQALILPFFFFRIMAISQGFNLPPTGKIGKTTTGHRSGNYILRVIPDVDENAERSEKQKAENSKFGILSYMLNSNLDYIRLGFPKAYQPLNYALKLNLPFVNLNDNILNYNLSKLCFSKGEGETAITTYIGTFDSTSNPYTFRVIYDNSGIGYPTPNADINGFILIPTLNKLIGFTSRIKRSENNRRFYGPNLRKYSRKQIFVYYFFKKGNLVSNTMFAGGLTLIW